MLLTRAADGALIRIRHDQVNGVLTLRPGRTLVSLRNGRMLLVREALVEILAGWDADRLPY